MKFSIITPVYNREDIIGRCIKSVLEQDTQFEMEMLIGYDISQDNTWGEMQKFVNDSRLKIITLPEHGGINAARNACIEAAQGDYIIILDSDDWFVSNAIEIIGTTIKQKPGYRYYMFAQDDRMSYFEKHAMTQNEYSEFLYNEFLTGKIGGDFMHCIESRIMKDYPFDPTVNSYEGVFFLRYYREAKRTLFRKIITVERERGREDSATLSTIRLNKKVVKKELCAEMKFLEWFAADVVDCGDLSVLCHHLNRAYEDSIILQDSVSKQEVIKMASQYDVVLRPRLVFIDKMGLGNNYYFLIRTFLYIKYKLLNTRVE